jgi:hypothetical protein
MRSGTKPSLDSGFWILDSVKLVQVGVLRESPPISPLSLRERARVRGF